MRGISETSRRGILNGSATGRGSRHLHTLFVRADDVPVSPYAQSGSRVAADRGEELVHGPHGEVPVRRQHRTEVARRVLHLPLHHQRLTLNEVAVRRIRRLVIEFLLLCGTEAHVPSAVPQARQH